MEFPAPPNSTFPASKWWRIVDPADPLVPPSGQAGARWWQKPRAHRLPARPGDRRVLVRGRFEGAGTSSLHRPGVGSTSRRGGEIGGDLGDRSAAPAWTRGSAGGGDSPHARPCSPEIGSELGFLRLGAAARASPQRTGVGSLRLGGAAAATSSGSRRGWRGTGSPAPDPRARPATNSHGRPPALLAEAQPERTAGR